MSDPRIPSPRIKLAQMCGPVGTCSDDENPNDHNHHSRFLCLVHTRDTSLGRGVQYRTCVIICHNTP